MKSVVLASFASLVLGATIYAAEPDGSLIYTQRCAVCHDSKTMERTPPREELKKRTDALPAGRPAAG